jgi:sodium/potassium-transporting ATPase subunit alpha
MRILELSAADAISGLNSSLEGLSCTEGQRRLHEYGPNRFEEVIRESLLWRFLKEFTNFFALVLWLAAETRRCTGYL